MMNKTNGWIFIGMNLVYSITFTIVFWFILPKDISRYVLLILFFWFLYTRATSYRLKELRDMVEINNELLIEVLQKDPNFNLREFMERNGYEDDE